MTLFRISAKVVAVSGVFLVVLTDVFCVVKIRDRAKVVVVTRWL